MKRVKALWVLASLLIMAGLIAPRTLAADDAGKVSKPFEYRGYSKAECTGVEKRSAYVPMSDGARLAIDIYLPTGCPASSWPVIIEYTPYTRAFIDLKNGPLHRSVRKMLLKSESPVLDLLAVPGGMADAVREVIRHGYVFVRADMRGCGASSGWKVDFMPQIGKDGGEMVDWIAEQPWCDGNVGMIGGSYSGYSQIVTAGHAGPALKAIAPTVAPLDGYDGEVYPGGVYLYKFMNDYSRRLGTLNLNYYTLEPWRMLFDKHADMFLPAAPVVDEDGDGDLIDEVPLDLNRNGTFLDDYNYPDDPADEPRYPDGKKREHVYYLAVREHRLNADYHFWAQNLMYIDEKMPYPMAQYSSYDFSPSSQVPSIMKKQIAVYNIGGWFDTFTRGTTEYYATMKDTNPSRMLITPSFHGGGGPYWEYLGEEKTKFMKLLLPELLRFFDYYLKGVDNGFADEPPILIYVMNGGGFRAENEWPLSRQVETPFYFGADHRLGKTSVAGVDRYRVDYTHDSRYGKAKGNRYLAAMGVTPDALPYRTNLDKKCLTYESAPLGQDTEVTGHPIVHFFVSSSADYGDFFIYLEDVDEQGQALLVSEGVLRAGFAGLVDNDKIIMGGGSGVDVLPDLPWHGFERADYVESIFAGKKVIELTIDFRPTSWVFKKGHSIRVSIAGADWPTFRLHPRLAPSNDASNPTNIVPVITVHRGPDRQSRIVLPIIPK